MRAIDFANHFLPMCGYSLSTFNSKQSRDEITLAFGLERRILGGTLLDLDVATQLAVDELTPAFTAKYAAKLQRAFSDEWLKGVGIADTQSEPVFFMVAEFGEVNVGRRSYRDRQRVGVVTFDGMAFSDAPKAEVPDRVTLINIGNILRTVRARAKKLGLDFSEPFFPPPDNPQAAKMLSLAKGQREYALRILRGEPIQQPATGKGMQ